jgi:hypothetical protein
MKWWSKRSGQLTEKWHCGAAMENQFPDPECIEFTNEGLEKIVD